MVEGVQQGPVLVGTFFNIKTPRQDSMMYAVSSGSATSTAATSKLSPTPAPS